MKQKFLDMYVRLSFDHIRLELFHYSLEHAMTGQQHLREKYRFPLPVGEKKHVISRLAPTYLAGATAGHNLILPMT
eukprot:310491-Karenia_brevis.AAC.1